MVLTIDQYSEKPTIVRGVPMEDYHRDRTHLSKSLLAKLDDSPAHFLHARKGGQTKTTDAMRFGAAAHMAVTDPELFAASYHVMPDSIVRNAKQEPYKQQLAIAAGRQNLKQAELEKTAAISHSLMLCPMAADILKPGAYVEATILWQDTATKIRLKSRPDLLFIDDAQVVDFKMTSRADPEGFQRIAFDKHYDISSAMISAGFLAATGRPLKAYYFVAIETDAPHVVQVYDALKPDREGVIYAAAGGYRLSQLLEKYLRCVKLDRWPGYSESVQPMSIPSYEIRKMEKELEEAA